MVMGPTHAMSGAAAGLAVAAILPPALGGPSSTAEAFVWGGVCAGTALLPDLDLPQSTVARAFGETSVMVSRTLNTVSELFYKATRTSVDNHRDGGHRTLTHTLGFAVGLGILVSLAVTAIGRAAIVVTLFLTIGLAIRGLAGNWAKQNGAPAVFALSAVLAFAAWAAMPSSTGSTSLGIAVTLGCITHCLGDAITKQGVPILAPFVTINGKRWWEVALPGPMRIRANGAFEKVALLPALSAVTAALMLAALPGVAELLE